MLFPGPPFLSPGLSAISICVIATNGAVKGGGPNFLISRSLGAHVGAACGFCYYMGAGRGRERGVRALGGRLLLQPAARAIGMTLLELPHKHLSFPSALLCVHACPATPAQASASPPRSSSPAAARSCTTSSPTCASTRWRGRKPWWARIEGRKRDSARGLFSTIVLGAHALKEGVGLKGIFKPVGAGHQLSQRIIESMCACNVQDYNDMRIYGALLVALLLLIVYQVRSCTAS